MNKAEQKVSIGELSDKELEKVTGGKQLPGSTIPGKIVLKRGNSL